MDYYLHLLILIGIYLIFAQSFNLNFGLGKLFNLAHVSAYAVGAYATALLSTPPTNADVFTCMVSSVLLSGLFALLLGGISLRLQQDYFAIGTLAFSSVVSALLINWKSLTRGVLGIPGIPRPELLDVDFSQNLNFVILTYVLVFVVLTFFYLIFRSPYARSLRAQAEFEYGALSLGKNTTTIRNISFFLASAFAGLAGSLFAYYINYVDPSSFSLSEMVFVLTIVTIGKPGSFWGVVLSTMFLVLLPEGIRFIYQIPESVLGPLRQMIYALILFGVVYWKKDKMFPQERQV